MAKLMGVEYGSEEFPAMPLYKTFQPEGQRWDKALAEFCLKYESKELEKMLAANGFPRPAC